MGRRPGRALAALLLLIAVPSGAAPVTYRLTPGPVRVEFRAYGMGVVPIEGGFRRFDGSLKLDDPSACTVDLIADAASLQMPSQSMTQDALGTDGLDAAKYPDFRLQAHCDTNHLVGTLLLHGVSRPVSLAIERRAAQWEASGQIRRAEWGMDARPWTAGPTVRISLVVGLPR